jgi:hypothetical protein
MRNIVTRFALIVPLLAAWPVAAQSIRGAVLAKNEPHHHPTYEDSTLRVLRVRVGAHDSTLLHEHDPDYFWIALGPSEVVNAKPGIPDATIKSADRSIHYTPGHFAHVARNPGTVPFDNITVELLRPQTNVHNLCEPALASSKLSCGDSAEFTGASAHPAFATNQLRVSLVTIPANGTMVAGQTGRGAWFIALDTADTKSALVLEAGARWRGGVYRAPLSSWRLRNSGAKPVRLLVVMPSRV